MDLTKASKFKCLISFLLALTLATLSPDYVISLDAHFHGDASLSPLIILDSPTALTLSSIGTTTKPLALVSPLIFNISIFQLLTVIFVRLFHTSNTMHHTRTHHYPIKPVHSFDICTSVNSIPVSSERLQHSNLSKSLHSLLLYILTVANLYWLSLKYLLHLFLPFNSHCSHLV